MSEHQIAMCLREVATGVLNVFEALLYEGDWIEPPRWEVAALRIVNILIVEEEDLFSQPQGCGDKHTLVKCPLHSG